MRPKMLCIVKNDNYFRGDDRTSFIQAFSLRGGNERRNEINK